MKRIRDPGSSLNPWAARDACWRIATTSGLVERSSRIRKAHLKHGEYTKEAILAQRRGKVLLRELIAADRLRRRNEFREVKAQFRKLGV